MNWGCLYIRAVNDVNRRLEEDIGLKDEREDSMKVGSDIRRGDTSHDDRDCPAACAEHSIESMYL